MSTELLTTKQEREQALAFFQRVTDQTGPSVELVFTYRLMADFTKLEGVLAETRAVLTQIVTCQLPELTAIQHDAQACLRAWPTEKEPDDAHST